MGNRCILWSHSQLSWCYFPSVLQVQCLQQSLDEVKNQYSLQLNQLQVTITTLEMEMQQLKLSIEKQQTEYNLLLDIKMRLELEIAEYRRLLDGEKKWELEY